MIKFFQLRKQGLPVTEALNQAQNWLKNLTHSELNQWLEEINNSEELNLTEVQKQKLQKLVPQGEALPFESAYYWAAFYGVG